MAHPARRRFLSEEEYLAAELASEVRHEYLGGEIHAMVSASEHHNLIALNLATTLHPRIRGTGCQLFMADMKLRLETAGEVVFYYPDLMLCCDPDDRATYYRTRPCLIVEVLSEATERIDRREKRYAYTGIGSLQTYLLVAQDERRVELHRRADGWRKQVFTSGEVPVDCLDLAVPLDVIYEGVELPASS